MSVSEQSTVNLDGTTRIEVAAGDSVNSAIRVNMVAGTVTISGADGAIQDGVDPLIRATVKDYPNSNPIAVVSVNTNGDPVSASGMTDAEFAAHLPLAIAEPVSVDDNGGSLTVDGVFFQAIQPVSGTFFQATQPISAAALPLPAGAATSALQTQPGVDIGDVTVNNAAGASAVNIQDGGNSVTVDGTVAVSAVTSITNVVHVDDNAGSLTVDGTVSITANSAVNVAQLAGTTTDTNSGNKSAGTLRVVLATDQPALTNKLLVTPDSVALPANQSVNVAQFGASNISTGTGAGGAGIPRVTVSNDSNVIVTPPTLTKGTQGATGFSTQDLKDAGRVNLIFYAVGAAAGATTVETMITLTKASDTSAISTGTTFVITSGKRWRINNITFASQGSATATLQTSTFALRINTAGAVIVSSTPLVLSARTSTPATASSWDRFTFAIPDGIEFLGNGTIQFGVSANAVFVTNAPTWHVVITGFEY